MRNCLILGSGRSGTSMTAGILSKTKYFMGEELYERDEANPMGYFEDKEINQINEDLLSQVLPPKPPGLIGKIFFKSRLTQGQRWLAEVPVGTPIFAPPAITARIRVQTDHEFFCFKDPRFCYTLPAWRPFLKNPVFICVFRDPGETAESIVKECKREPYLQELNMNFAQALRVWRLMYRHVLETHFNREEDWIFAHYDQFLDGSILKKVSKLLDVEVDYTFADPKLKRSTSNRNIPQAVLTTYKQMCDLAGFTGK